MSLTTLPAGLVAATLVALYIIRSRSLTIKIATETVLLVALSTFLLSRGGSLLPAVAGPHSHPDEPWLRALAVIWWLIGSRVIASMAALVLGRDARSRQARLFSDLVAAAIYLTAVLIILNSVLDLPVKGVLATSGVVAIVLGLALQNTLADLFSGVAVGLEQPFHVGDRVTIGDHSEGVVVEMNWRSIRVQTDGEDVATIPNSIVAKSQIVNRSVPTERRAASVDVPTRSTARAETLIELIRQAILLCPDILTEPAPSVNIKRIGTRKTVFSIGYYVATSGAMSRAQSQLLRQIRRFFRHAGVQDGHMASDDSLLRGLVLFETLTDEQIAHLVQSLVRRKVDPGSVLFEQDSHGASLYILQAGVFEISRHEADGRHRVFGRIGPGEYLGEISMMSGAPRHATVVAMTRGEVVELPGAAIKILLSQDSRLGAALEESVKRGLALLDRDDAARASHPLDAAGSLLARIRSFLLHTRE